MTFSVSLEVGSAIKQEKEAANQKEEIKLSLYR
jgi:hypothetical protein